MISRRRAITAFLQDLYLTVLVIAFRFRFVAGIQPVGISGTLLA